MLTPSARIAGEADASYSQIAQLHRRCPFSNTGLRIVGYRSNRDERVLNSAIEILHLNGRRLHCIARIARGEFKSLRKTGLVRGCARIEIEFHRAEIQALRVERTRLR